MIYMASKTKHYPKWQFLRDNFDVPISSRWIDYGTKINDFNVLWKHCLEDINKSDYFIIYDENDPLKGALIELGYAFSKTNLKIISVNLDYSISEYENLIIKPNLKEAFKFANVNISKEFNKWLQKNT